MAALTRLDPLSGLGREARLLAATELLWGAGFGLLAPIWPLYLASLGAAPTEIGLVLAFGNVTAALCVLPAGAAADRFGRRRVILACYVLSTIGAAAFVPLTDWPGAFAGSAVYFIGSAALPVMNAHLAATEPREKLGRAMGVVYGAFFAGTIVGGPLSGLVGAAWGLRAAVAASVIAFALSTLVVAFVRSTRASADAAPGMRFPRAFWILLLLTPATSLAAVLPAPLLPVYLREVAGVPLERIGVFVALVALGAAATSAVSGRVADRLGPAPALIGSAAILALGALATLLLARVEALLAIGTLLLGASRAAVPVITSALERVLPVHRAALGYSAFQLAYGVGFASANALAGVLYDADPALPLLVTAALALPVAATIALALTAVTRGAERPSLA